MKELLEYQINVTGLSNGLVIPAGFVIEIHRILIDANQNLGNPTGTLDNSTPPKDIIDTTVNIVHFVCASFSDSTYKSALKNDIFSGEVGYEVKTFNQKALLPSETVLMKAIADFEAFLTTSYGASSWKLLVNNISK